VQLASHYNKNPGGREIKKLLEEIIKQFVSNKNSPKAV